MNRDECEGMGKIYVEGYRRRNGIYVKSHCSERRDKVPEKMNLIPHVDNFPVRADHEVGPSDKSLSLEGAGEASRNFKLPKSNTLNARKTYGSLKQDEKALGTDLRKQDFQDAQFQSIRLGRDAQAEMLEDERLAASQMVRANERYAQQKRKIAKREYVETKRKISAETKAIKHNIKKEKKRISHAKRQKRRGKKLDKLSNK